MNKVLGISKLKSSNLELLSILHTERHTNFSEIISSKDYMENYMDKLRIVEMQIVGWQSSVDLCYVAGCVCNTSIGSLTKINLVKIITSLSLCAFIQILLLYFFLFSLLFFYDLEIPTHDDVRRGTGERSVGKYITEIVLNFKYKIEKKINIREREESVLMWTTTIRLETDRTDLWKRERA